MPSVPAVHCEARKVAYRQTKDGLVVSFVIHPNDMPDALAVAPLGQRYMLALAAIGDDEQPIGDGLRAEAGDRLGTDSKSPLGREREGLSPAPLPSTASQRGKERYLESTASQQALIRAARLPKDERFRAWVAKELGIIMAGEGATEQYIRDYCCDGGSRRLISEEPECHLRFIALETAFKIGTGQMAEVR